MEGRLRRLLAVSWAMPPMLLPRSIQVSRLLRALPSVGWTASVICARPSEPIPGVFMDEHFATRMRGGYELRPVTYGMDRISLVLARCGLLRRIPSAGHEADEAWRGSATRAVMTEIKRTSPAAMVSFAQPWVDHLVALDIHRSTGIPWIAHVSDPWVDSPYSDDIDADTLATWRKQEAEVIARADLIVFTNHIAARLVMDKYETHKHKARVLPHCFIPAATDEVAPGHDRLRLFHSGDFFAGKRTPSTLFQAVHVLKCNGFALDRLEIVFAGNAPSEVEDEVCQLGLSDIVEFLGKVDSSTVDRCARLSQVLMVIDAPIPNSPFLPSKAVDYLAYNRPILGITPRSGATGEFLSEFGFNVIEPGDVAATADWLAQLLGDKKYRLQHLPTGFEELAARYSVEHVATQFATQLNEAATL